MSTAIRVCQQTQVYGNLIKLHSMELLPNKFEVDTRLLSAMHVLSVKQRDCTLAI